MIPIRKLSTRLLTIMIALIAAIMFSAHSDDAPFKSFGRSVVKQKVPSSSQTAKASIDFSTAFAVNEAKVSPVNLPLLKYKSWYSDQILASIFTQSVPPYRGPPTVSALI
jgi:hypothetical protein